LLSGRRRGGGIDGDKCPVVMTTGTYDYLTTPEMTEATASRIKGAEFIEMQDIGHFPMSENYPVFRKYLVQALARIEARLGAPV
jgi:pimeloyl-ACP methyl ester carboxylesterase